MRIQQEVYNIQESANFETSSFSIEADAVAFDILSSKLYSDPHLAIVRELSTNAWDAHVEAGTERKPFDVHLPNRLEPFFSIRDYGTGMSHQDIMTLYTTYFKSTKRSTNKQAGAWGLGSKSPFSYTDNFMVISWFEGKKRTYSMVKGKKGFPVVKSMGTIDSDEPDGLEVRFACKPGDTGLFLEKARRVYKRFPTQPNLKGGSRFKIERKKVLLSNGWWKIYDGKGDSHAIMGPIGYPIQGYQLNIPVTCDLVNSLNIDIKFPIGALEISASREELQYSERTKAVLNDALLKIKEEFFAKLNEEFQQCENLWDARILYEKMFSHGSSLYYYRTSLCKDLNWKGKKIFPLAPDITAAAECTKYETKTDKHGSLSVRSKSDCAISSSHNIKLMFNDLDGSCAERIRHWMKTDGLETKVVYLVELHKCDKLHEDTLHKLLGTTPNHFTLTSSLPRPKRKKSNRKGTKSKIPIAARGFRFKELKYYYSGREDEAWEPATIDLYKPSIYVKWKRNCVEKGSSSSLYGPGVVAVTLGLLEKIGSRPKELYAIKSGYVKKALEIEPDWTELWSYAWDRLDKFVKAKGIEEKIKAKLTADYTVNFSKLEQIAQFITKPSPLKNLVDAACSAKNVTEDIEAAIDLASRLNYRIERGPKIIDTDEIDKRYPMIKWIEPYYHYQRKEEEKYKAAARYVELIDEMEGR